MRGSKTATPVDDGYTRRGDGPSEPEPRPVLPRPGLVRYRVTLWWVATLTLLAVFGESRPSALVVVLPVVLVAIWLAGEWQRRVPQARARRSDDDAEGRRAWAFGRRSGDGATTA